MSKMTLFFLALAVTFAPAGESIGASTPDSNDWFYNPFTAESAHHRPIGTGAVYASKDDPITKSWLTADALAINVGTPWGLYIAEADESGPILTVNRRPGTSRIELPQKVRFPVGGIKIDTDGRDGNVAIYDRVTKLMIHLRQYSWNNGKPVAGSYRKYDLKSVGNGMKLNDRIGTSASGVASPFAILRGWEVEKAGHPIGHALQVIIPRVKGSKPIMLAREVWWPAVGMDNSAYKDQTANTGHIPYGCLLALPTVEKGGPDLKKLGLSEKGLRLAECLRDYGMYVTDGGGGPALRADQDFDRATRVELREESKKFYSMIRAVVNSVPEDGKVKYRLGDPRGHPSGGPGHGIIPGTFPAGGGTPLAPNTAIHSDK